MKLVVPILLASWLAFLPACVSPKSQLAVQQVGPNPARNVASYGPGYLMVYSAWSPFDNDLTTDHTGYTILANDGKTVRKVHNYIVGDYTQEPPTRVSLAPGSYRINAESQDYGILNVPVLIKSGEVTSVYLDCSSQPTRLTQAESKIVKLPDGEVIGWAANAQRN